MNVKSTVVFALSCLTALPVTAWDCNHKADRALNEDLAGITKVVLDARAGDLEITGVKGASAFKADGEACASKEKALDEIQLVAERKGDTLMVKVQMPENKNWNQQARLDLDIEMADDVLIDIDDSSGDATFTGVLVGLVDDGSGDLRFDKTHGKLRLEDGSGDVRIDGHRGDVSVEDGSGSVRISDLEGNVFIDEDGSGDLTMKRISGSVKVDSDGSGDIVVAEVGGDFTVDRAGSGDVRHNGVAGKVDIPSRD